MPKSKRLYWGNTDVKLPELDLIAVQKESYQWFLDEGIKITFDELGPIEDFTGKNWRLQFGNYSFLEPKLTPTQAKEKGLTYDMPLKVEATLTNKQTGQATTQEIFLGDIPRMTPTGTFIINGIERAVVNQLVRSPGVFYSGEVDQNSGRLLYRAELRPLRGSWLEILVARNDTVSIKIDRHRKIPVTVLLRAIGYSSDEEIKKLFEDNDTDDEHLYIDATIAKDSTKTREEALIEIYQRMRPGEPAVLDNAKELLEQMFFDSRRYDLGSVGRYKLNRRLKLDVENIPQNHVLTVDDIVASIRYLIDLQNKRGKVDDIDHLSNRRVRCVGELVNNAAFRVGMLRLERSIREKMSLTKTDEVITPSSLVNARPVIATISEFFRRNRLSTILDQTNPLSEIDNLRRLSVMGTGGVTRERASFSMRDINASQYSRICPVRSPEGPNIGLVTYMALYTRVNEYGFLEAPYRKVVSEQKGDQKIMRVTDEIIYLQADEEEDHYITHAEVEMDDNGVITQDWVPVRYNSEFLEASAEQIEYMDIVPRQVVGTSASLIPFISHDESNRALMGTHMQCQAVPLIKPASPIVGTGMETAVVKALERAVFARHAGEVTYTDADKVVVKLDKPASTETDDEKREFIELKGDTETYYVQKFVRSANSTCYSQSPRVTVGQKINQGDLLIDGPAAENGELALGQNLTIAYCSFDGLGYEDAIVLSDRVVQSDLLTSIHINEHEANVMDTKLGAEELTRDIPNVGESDLANLAEDGIIVIGSEVASNDILVGKIAPKGETELTPEERLLRAIFGEKAREVRDTSLRLPYGQSGTVIDVKILSREDGDELDPGVIKKVIVRVAEMRKITVGDKLAGRHGNKGVISKIVPAADMPFLADGTPVDIIISPLSVLARMNLGQLLEAHLGWAAQKLGYKVALPVFEEVNEEVIERELEKANLPTSGKVQLFDGRTGEPLGEQTVVGVGYILKLIHMVEDKIHARSTGPYSLVTQQPLGGKAQMGGQRLGEMEVWVLEAHKAAYSLQEMLTIKSDDVVGRAKAFEAIVKDTPIPESNIPESFKVLVKELNSLCLDIVPTQIIEEEIDDEEDSTQTASTATDDSDDTPTDEVETESDTDSTEESEEEADDAELEPDTDDIEEDDEDFSEETEDEDETSTEKIID